VTLKGQGRDPNMPRDKYLGIRYWWVQWTTIYTSADSGHATLLVSLDLNAAFDTMIMTY